MIQHESHKENRDKLRLFKGNGRSEDSNTDIKSEENMEKTPLVSQNIIVLLYSFTRLYS